MTVVKTHLLTKDTSLDPMDQEWVYNSLDCALTLEVYEALTSLTNESPVVYQFERALQAPLLDMMLRGIKIDEMERQQNIKLLRSEVARIDSILQRYAIAVWDKPLNPNSPKQLQDFFYNKMKIPEIWISQKGVKKLSMNREVLEKIEVYFHAMPIITCIFELRDRYKSLQVLESQVDPDGRIRTSYNMSTETGRLSSSKSVEGTGGNLQNVTRSLRKMFVPDKGWKFCNIDLEQTESRDVGFLQGSLFNDWTYLDACEKGDLHTTTCKLVWPGLGWTNDAAQDRKIADKIFYRFFTHRDMSKRGGHLSNYMGTAWTAARSLKVPLKIMETFQQSYLKAYPAFTKWWQYTAQELQVHQELTTPFGRTRQFFGRATDQTTLREAIAFVPQSMTADRMNLGIWRIWKYMPEVQILAQVHDSILFQYREEQEHIVIPKALKHIETPLTSKSGRTMIVPGEAKIGWNWMDFDKDKNPLGLTKYKIKK